MYLIALGANLPTEAGGPLETLTAALARFSGAGLAVTARSPWYRTPAHPPASGPDYVNAVVRAEAGLAPARVLAALHRIERSLGRSRDRRWGARTCDLDLLAADDLVLPDAATQAAWRDLPAADQAERVPDRLILPHPRLQDRGFVLVPLCDVAPGWVHPLLGRSARELLAALPEGERSGIVRL